MPSPTTKSAFAGMLAGLAESLAVHPSDVIKTRSQARNYQNEGICKAFHNAFKYEGVAALYKGLIPTVATIMPKVTLQMGGLAYFKPIFHGSVPDVLVPSCAGICTGIVQAVVFLTPAETVKVRQQTQTGWGGKYDSMSGTTIRMCKEEGIGSLYKGLAATTMRQSWGLVVKFSGYECIKAFFLQLNRHKHNAEEPQLAGWQHAAAGGITNIAVGVLNSPPDVVKTRLQDQSFAAESGVEPYKGTWDCVRTIYRTEGILAFFRGSVMRIVRIAPGGAIQFGVYGTVLDWLERNW